MPNTGARIASSSQPADHIHVVAAAICDQKDHVLIARRPDHVHQGGKWEFPGGKVEPGEGIEQALRRELAEELGILPTAYEPLITVKHRYPDKRVLLDAWRVSTFQGTPKGREGQIIAWVARTELSKYTFPEANQPIISALDLPDTYLITPEPGADRQAFLKAMEKALHCGHALIQLRAKALQSDGFFDLAKHVRPLCDQYGARLVINGPPQWAQQVHGHGVHLCGQRLYAHRTRPLPPQYLIGASCHNAEDLAQATRIDVDFAVLSPVKHTLSHPEALALGWTAFRALCEQASFPVYALGGLGLQDLKQAKRHGAQGVAAIRAFWPDSLL